MLLRFAMEPSRQSKEVVIPNPITVRDLADLLKRKAFEIIGDLMSLGLLVNFKTEVEFKVASQIAQKLGLRAVRETSVRRDV